MFEENGCDVSQMQALKGFSDVFQEFGLMILCMDASTLHARGPIFTRLHRGGRLERGSVEHFHVACV